jgi:hypothetical protein
LNHRLSGDIAELTRTAWYLGIRYRQAMAAYASCSNRELRERLSRDLSHFSAQAELIRARTETMAAACGPEHWELPLLREVMRRRLGNKGLAGLA